jgi:hypothetical protein
MEDDEMQFRTIAAPGLEEDDVFAAMYGLPGRGLLWGEGVPKRFPRTEPEWSAEQSRRDRHDALMEKWAPVTDDTRPGEDSPPGRQTG